MRKDFNLLEAVPSANSIAVNSGTIQMLTKIKWVRQYRCTEHICNQHEHLQRIDFIEILSIFLK